MTMTQTCGSRFTLVALALAASLPTSTSAHAQEVAASLADASFPPNTLVARYGIDPSVFADVTNSVELVAAFRKHLMVEVAMPLDESLRVHLSGRVADPVGGGAYPFLYSGLGFEVESDVPLSTGFASIVRSSHGPDSAFDDWDWNEDEAWDWLLNALQTGLTNSLAAMGEFQFQAGEDGTVPLTVAAVHTVSSKDWEFEENLERLYLRLHPKASFGSAAIAGWEPPEGYSEDVQVLVIELEAPPLPELPSIDVAPEALDRLVGSYEIEAGPTFNIRREGASLIASSSGGGADDIEFPLHALSETEFWTDDAPGGRTKFIFTLGDDGRAASVTMEVSGFSMTWPRIP